MICSIFYVLNIGFGVIEEIKETTEHGAASHITSTRGESSESMLHAVPSSLFPPIQYPLPRERFHLLWAGFCNPHPTDMPKAQPNLESSSQVPR